MEKERNHMTERLLQLTLEIIYLLTGEDYGPVIKRFDDPPSPSLIYERTNDKKILEVTQKIIDLLTGEVPIRCQDVTVYFSMEEWEYIEGHKDLYKDVMMENWPPLTSQDGSSNRNTPERCPSPAISQGSTQEHHQISKNHQGEDLIMIKVETLDGKEMYVRVQEQCEEEDSPPEIGRDGRYTWNNIEDDPLTSPDGEIEDHDFMLDYPIEKPIPRNLHPVFRNAHLSPDPLAHREFFLEHLPSGTFHTASRGGEAFPCPECEECFTQEEDLLSHQSTHTEIKLYSCFECGKCFPWKAFLIRHQRTHTGEKPYSCAKCRKCFAQKSALVRHERIHTGQKPYSCSECGKHFSERSNLINHEMIHTSQKPFHCPECGECFDQRGPFISHRRSHAGVGPFTCSVCGKYFSFKSLLVRHQRSHTGEKPFSCSECGRCFAWRSALIRHERIHMAKKPFS